MARTIRLRLFGSFKGPTLLTVIAEEAEKRLIAGWVRHRRDGTIEVLALGEEDQLKPFARVCRAGCEENAVTDIQLSATDEPVLGDRFLIEKPV